MANETNARETAPEWATELMAQMRRWNKIGLVVIPSGVPIWVQSIAEAELLDGEFIGWGDEAEMIYSLAVRKVGMREPEERLLDWEIGDYDEDDNPIFHATSALCEEEGSPFRWRIQMKLVAGRVIYELVGDAELMLEDEETRFETLRKATHHCAQQEKQMCEAYDELEWGDFAEIFPE